jgi:hypothetical protein
MPYASQRDRTVQELEFTKLPWPAPPLNLFMTSGYERGVIDLTWDNPTDLALNSRFRILGVNLYRSFDSDFGPFQRVTDLLVGSRFWRDRTDNELVVEEDVTGQFVLFGECAAVGDRGPRYVFKTRNYPIVKEGSQQINADTGDDIRVYIDGQEARVLNVWGSTGEVEIDPFVYVNVATQSWDPSLIPAGGGVPAQMGPEVGGVPGGGNGQPTSTVTCTYRYTRQLIRTDLFQRIHYRATCVGIPIDKDLSVCQPQDLVETPIEHATATHTMEIEKLDWIWREAIRRNRWILEQGGERVKVFLRKNVGLLCPCIPDDYHHQPINDDPTCFVPGTLVSTELGWRPIEEIKEGERVLSADGMYHVVKGCLKRPYAGPLLSITSSINTNPIRVTPEHPFLTLRGSHGKMARSGGRFKGTCGPKCDKFIARGDGNAYRPNIRQLPSGNWWARAQIGGSRESGRVVLGTFPTQDEAAAVVQAYKQGHWVPGHALEWDEARNIVQDDWLTAQWFSGIHDLDKVRVPKKYFKTSKYGPKRLGATEFVVDEDFLWMIGMYLAEGCKNRSDAKSGGITFSLHAKETVYQERLVAFFRRYGFNPSVRRSGNGNGVVVVVNSVTLNLWFPRWLGDGCTNKRIPQELMRLPFTKCWALIQGVHDGDGSKRDHEITQTSEVLALQLVELFHRVGEQPLVRQQRSTKLTPKGNVRKLAYCVSWAEDTLVHENRKGRWAFNGRILARVREVVETSYCGPVYNLEIEGDPTYIVNGIASHNCFGTGIIGGYDGPYDVILSPADSERKIRQSPQGRTGEQTYEVFTGPVPLLSMRDFLVKINGDRYSIGGVRLPSNRGNVMQQHFNIGHIDEKDIRSRVPMSNPVKFVATQLKPTGPELEAEAEITDDPNVPVEQQLRGRTLAWKNIEY